jgi:hypothetical protein
MLNVGLRGTGKLLCCCSWGDSANRSPQLQFLQCFLHEVLHCSHGYGGSVAKLAHNRIQFARQCLNLFAQLHYVRWAVLKNLRDDLSLVFPPPRCVLQAGVYAI